ncbi:hypothetical protein [Rhodovulum adriaticum]|uniref:Uncharacterized protein n=1 Tax=Rhodovulum adriaticum TaxID=35804 RepID=A0A4R2NW23_RHOAD|nr:hypothetical protein [Rhodovulum adriaticum]MBK1635665.1 hypothetical protein [Rhodovulum adriaticum]TCP26172.1 hypothetical protein EV656_102135 [Rhodovulum adriaticum]
MTNYIWDAWLPKLSSKDRMTDVKFDADASSTPFSDMLGFDCLSKNTREVDLMTTNPTPFSTSMNWPVLGGTGEGHVELTTDNPTPLSNWMGWKLLSKRAYYGIAAHLQ